MAPPPKDTVMKISRDKEVVMHLKPGLFAAGRQSEWTEQNRSLITSLHPLYNKVAIAVEGKKPREELKGDIKIYNQDKTVQICNLAQVPDERLPFINDTHAVFVALQSIMEANSTDNSETHVDVSIESIIRISGLYREAMLRQIKTLQNGETERGNGMEVSSGFIQSEIDIFQAMHAIWHLFEIIYLTTNTSSMSQSVVPQFLEWLNQNLPSPLAEEGQRIVGDASSPNDIVANSGLWDYLKKLTMRGHIHILANILENITPSRLLSAPASKWAREIATTSRDMPLTSNEETAGSFNARWRRWSERCHNIAVAISGILPEHNGGNDDDGDDDQSDNKDIALSTLYTISEIMRGNADIISAEGKSWQDVLGAVLLYNEPTAGADSLPGLCEAVTSEFVISEFSTFDKALVALLNQDLSAFVVYCNQIDISLSAHIVDLMDHISILEKCREVMKVEPRTHYLIALAETYLCHENIWRVAFDYFGAAQKLGIAAMEEYIIRIPLDSDRKSQQVLRVCDKYQLSHASNRIHRQLGQQKWQRGRLGAAIVHFAHVRDMNSIGAICDRLWDGYLKTGKLTYGPIIDGAMADGLKHDRLQFLSKYRDFHECMKSKSYVEAGRTILSILVNKIAPQYAILNLLVDSIPLLEGEVLVFGPDDTFELMRCAESLVQSPFPIRNPKGQIIDTNKDEISMFNIACTHNLARSFITF